MFRAVSTALVIVGMMVAGGCQTLTHDSDQQVRKYSRIAEVNRRMLAEDIDTILLLDSPSGLSQWYVRPQ